MLKPEELHLTQEWDKTFALYYLKTGLIIRR